MSEVFVSYVKEDSAVVTHLCRVLEANGIKVWLDRDQLEPGVRWKVAIEHAIRRGMFFLSVHSRSRQNRAETYANEELIVAIEQLRRKPFGATWFIPVKIDDCDIEARPIGAGETILDFQIADLRTWGIGIEKLLKSLGVADPKVDHRKPLGAGIAPALEVSGGFIRYDKIDGAPEIFQGMEHRVSAGWCRRMDDDSILAYFEITAPLKQFQDFNRFLGYTGFHANCLDKEVSVDPANRSLFSFQRSFIAPKGTPMPNLSGAGMETLAFDLPFVSRFEAFGYFDGTHFIGNFVGHVEMTAMGQTKSQASCGIFEIEMREPQKLSIGRP
jgi:hypothetical protein